MEAREQNNFDILPESEELRLSLNLRLFLEIKSADILAGEKILWIERIDSTFD